MSLGNKGSVARPDGYQYGPTSLDDVVKYVTPIEEVRVWLFRVTLVLAVGGLILVAFRKQQNAYWLILVLLWNAVHSAAFVGSERLRLQIDAYLIVLAAFFVDRLIVHLGRRKVLVPLNRV
jgi:hypothetical protein